MLKVVRRNKIAIDKLLFQAKTAIIKEGKKMALEYAYSLIPTEEQVIIYPLLIYIIIITIMQCLFLNMKKI